MKPNIFSIFLIVLFSPFLAFGQTPPVPEYQTLYDSGQYSKSVSILKRFVKDNPNDPIAWNYLGLSLTALKKEKEAVKAFETAVKILPADAKLRGNLAYAYYFRNDPRASNEARETIRLDPTLPVGYLVLAYTNMGYETYGVAYENANKVIALAPNMAEAYILKAQALLGNHFLQSKTIKREDSKRAETFKEAAESLERFVELRKDHPEIAEARQELVALKSIAEYYARVDAEKASKKSGSDADSGENTPFKIHSTPKATYSAEARDKGVNGIVRVLVELRPDGKIGHVIVIKPLGFGLDRQAIAAARGIKFTPATVQGKPVSSYATLEYGFATY